MCLLKFSWKNSVQSISEGKDDLPPTYRIDKNTWQD